jgi:D-amino-acid oxidase
MPFHCDDPRTDRWAMETLDELYPLGVNKSNSIVELVPTIALHRNNLGPTTEDFIAADYKLGTGGASRLPSWSSDARLEFQHLTIEMLWWQNDVYKLKIPSKQELMAAGYKYAWFFNPPIVDCPKMLDNMLQEVKSKAVDVNVETGIEYESIEHLLEDAKSLGCDGVVNCTGLGAKQLCDDDKLVGARGVLLHYNRQDCVRRQDILYREDGQDVNILTEDEPWGSEDMPCYTIARGNTIVVGGSYLKGDTEPNLRKDEHTKLLENARLLGIDTEHSSPEGTWAGFRPYRPVSRLELDQDVKDKDIRLVHSYGYGGSGWTVYTGAAKEATKLLLDDS